MSTTQESTSLTVVEHVQNFVSEHKKAILIGAAVVVAAGGVAYYASASSSKEQLGEVEKGKSRKDKKKKKRKTVKDPDGPILEERSPKPSSAGSPKSTVQDAKDTSAASVSDDPEAQAKALKVQGNSAYASHKFEEAVELYTRAIALSPTPEPAYFSNRAACYMNYAKPEYQKAIDDCTEALKLDNKYLRALTRRSTVYEKLGRLEDALDDLTAATLLSKFQDKTASSAHTRVLDKLTEVKTAEILAAREPRLPPHSFVDAYFSAFRPSQRPKWPESPSTGDNTLALALDALDARDYQHALTLVNESLEQGISFPEGKSRSLNLRGSFKFLWGDSAGASADLQEAIKEYPSYTQNWVKIASVHMEQNKMTEAFEAFEEAIKHNAADPDIYYHRGQVLFILGKYEEAAENYNKSLSMDSSFVFSHIQLAVAQYKNGNIANAIATFRRSLKAFPERSEPSNYYGELLLDQRRFEDAIERFENAIQIEKKKKHNMNVLPWVNKALAVFQETGSTERALEIAEEALKYDPLCEAAVATVAQLSLKVGQVEHASRMFKRQADLARAEPDIANAMQLYYAAYSQVEFAKNYPDLAKLYMQVEEPR